MKKHMQNNMNVLKRLKIVEGHLKKVINMVEEGDYCMDILQQTTAVKQAIKKAEILLLDEHLHSCVIQDVKKGSMKSVDELVVLFKRLNK